GQLPMAIVVCKELALIDHPSASKLVDELAAAYGKGSPRVDLRFRRKPPPPPQVAGDELGAPGSDTGSDTETARSSLRTAAAKLAKLTDTQLPAYPLFHSLKPGPFRRLVAATRVRDVPAKATVIEVGGPGDSFYVVARGTIRITRPHDTLG